MRFSQFFSLSVSHFFVSLFIFWGTLAHAQNTANPPIQLALIEGMSGPFANTGEAVLRNLVWAVERVNARGGVTTSEGKRLLVLNRYDSKGQSEEALTSLRSAIDAGAQYIFQGNSSANASALIDAIQKHNDREPNKRVVFLNYAAVDPALTQEKCNFWHFRFDAHADMRMTALMQVLKQDTKLKSVYLIGQDYSFGQSVLKEAKQQLEKLRPDVQILAEELHPMGRVKDFLPYASKIKASGAQAVITGNWGNDLSLLVKAAKDVGFEIYTLPNGLIEDGKLGGKDGTPPWRQYYNTRNHLWLAIDRKSFEIFIGWFIRELKYTYAILFFSNKKMERLIFKMRAIRDAVLNRRGKRYNPEDY